MTAELLTKEAVEFGEHVTLYRVIDADTGKGTLWHRDADRAWDNFERLFGPVPVVRDPESWQAVAAEGRKWQ